MADCATMVTPPDFLPSSLFAIPPICGAAEPELSLDWADQGLEYIPKQLRTPPTYSRSVYTHFWSLLGWRVPHMCSRLEYTGDIFLAYTMNPVKIDTSLHEEELLCCAWRDHTKKTSWIVEIQVTMDVFMQPLFEFSAHFSFPACAQLVPL